MSPELSRVPSSDQIVARVVACAQLCYSINIMMVGRGGFFLSGTENIPVFVPLTNIEMKSVSQ